MQKRKGRLGLQFRPLFGYPEEVGAFSFPRTGVVEGKSSSPRLTFFLVPVFF